MVDWALKKQLSIYLVFVVAAVVVVVVVGGGGVLPFAGDDNFFTEPVMYLFALFLFFKMYFC